MLSPVRGLRDDLEQMQYEVIKSHLFSSATHTLLANYSRHTFFFLWLLTEYKSKYVLNRVNPEFEYFLNN